MMINIYGLNHCSRFLLSIAGVLMLLSFAGCEGRGYYDHVPPSGKGSLIVDNNSGDEISIFLIKCKVEKS